jgi:hypothetical protein
VERTCGVHPSVERAAARSGPDKPGAWINFRVRAHQAGGVDRSLSLLLLACDTHITSRLDSSGPRAFSPPRDSFCPRRRAMTITALGSSQVPGRAAMAPEVASHPGSLIPCVYCRASIQASSFAFWSSAKRLLSANCPDCDRRVTIATSTWRRWIKQSVA